MFLAWHKSSGSPLRTLVRKHGIGSCTHCRLTWVTVPCRALTDIFWRNCVPPDLECGWQGVLNSMDIHQSVLG